MKNLKLLRTQHKMSQKEIGNIFHASQNTVSQWENGTRKPSYEIIQEIADYFEVSVDYLLGREERKPTLDEQLEGIEFALYGEVKELTDAQKQDILDYARFKKAQWEKENGNK